MTNHPPVISPFKKLPTLLAVCLLLGLSACHSSKPGVKYDPEYGAPRTDIPMDVLFRNLVDGYEEFSDLYMPVNLQLTSPAQFGISGRATFIRDREIQLSMRVLGMEAAVVYINTDDIYVVDKYHKIYFTEKLYRLLGDTGLTVGNIQDLLLGRLFIPGAGTASRTDAASYVATAYDDFWTLAPVVQFDGAFCSYSASLEESPVLKALGVLLSSGIEITCSYKAPTSTPAGILDSEFALNVPLPDKNVDLSITWGLKDAKWNSGRTVKFTPPSSGYRQITLFDLVKLLNSGL